MAERHRKSREELCAYQRKWCAANREKKCAYNRKKYAANREKICAYNRKYYAANREKVLRVTRKFSWIIVQLRRMARDNGLWQQLEKEYGKRSVRHPAP